MNDDDKSDVQDSPETTEGMNEFQGHVFGLVPKAGTSSQHRNTSKRNQSQLKTKKPNFKESLIEILWEKAWPLLIRNLQIIENNLENFYVKGIKLCQL